MVQGEGGAARYHGARPSPSLPTQLAAPASPLLRPPPSCRLPPAQAGDTSVKGFSDVIRKKSTVLQIKKDATVHSFAEEECMAFADFINTKLGADPHLACA